MNNDMNPHSNIEEAKSRLPLPKLMQELGYGDCAKSSARCMFHDDKNPSFGIFQKDGQWFWKCQAGCVHGNEIHFLAKVKGIDVKEATKDFLRMAGVPVSSVPKRAEKREQIVRQLSLVEMLPIVFVDKPLFQANAFHLLVGKKNAGKGTFLSSVAARFTRGELGEARNVIWIAAGEDS